MQKKLVKQTGIAKPFLKWAGGKGQLLNAIEKALPPDFALRNDITYIEPFAGSGAVLFWMLQKCPLIKKAVINDINTDLINTYSIIKKDPVTLIKGLQKIQNQYYKIKEEADRKSFFLEKRDLFNKRSSDVVTSTVLLIFLNRTCFNGLYRVNSNNEFNVPFGKYSQPRICDEETIMADSKLLQRVMIINKDYKDTLKCATKNSFFYFDPPYKPVSKTSSFNSYAKDIFNDDQQERLKDFARLLTSKGHQWLLSNSDPGDGYFDKLYSGTSVFIDRVKARRNINSVGSKRGEVAELLISNYKK